LNADEKKFLVVVITIVLLFIIISRTNVAETKTPEALFVKYEVVVFKNPFENENVTTETIQFLIEVEPYNMSSLYVKSWEFILISGELEKVIRSNYYYHSSASFTISEELYFDVYGHYKAILSLDCYYNKNGNHYTFDTVREFDYSRT